MLSRLVTTIRNQKGFTLVELLVSIALTGIIGVAIVSITFQTLAVNSADSNRIDAVKQLENALHWINRDAQMAWPSSIDNSTTGFPLELEWQDYTSPYYDPAIDNMKYKVKYSIDSTDGSFEREQIIDSGTPSHTRIAGNIDNSTSNYTFDGSILTVNLWSTVNGFRSATETRTLQIKPRTNN